MSKRFDPSAETRTRELRAVRASGGGHKLAADAGMHLPWAGIFEPWREFVAVAMAAETVKTSTQHSAFSRRATTSKSYTSKSITRKSKWKPLQGVQLALDFTPYYEKPAPSDPERPLFDLFPEAYA